MNDHSLHRGRKHLSWYCVHAFITGEIFIRHILVVLELMVNTGLRCIKRVNILNSKILKERQSHNLIQFMIYADFELILVREEIGMQNPNEFNTKQYQKHVPCSYAYKLVCLDDKFSRPFKSNLEENNFVSSSPFKSNLDENIFLTV